MNRRDFLRALGLGSAVCALSPLLDLAPIEAARSAMSMFAFVGSEVVTYGDESLTVEWSWDREDWDNYQHARTA